MAGWHHTSILGNVGKEPELRYTANGTAVCNFSVAVNTKFGEREETTWYRVVLWDKVAEVAGQYLTKGKEVLISGSMQERRYEDKEGNKRTSWELVGREMKFVGKADNSGGQYGGGGDIDPDDLPFEN